MIPSVLSCNANNSRGMAHILSAIDYKKLSRQLRYAAAHADDNHTIILLEYVHSGIYDTIAEIERIPGTTQPINDFLLKPEVENALKSLFVSADNMRIYTRRKYVYKADGSYDLAKQRQLILYISADLPSLIPPQADPWGTSYTDVID